MKNLNEIYHSVNWGDPLQMNVQYMAGQLWKELLEEFSQTVQQSSGYFAFAAGVSQADTPAPGMADIVSGAMILGGLLVCAVISTYDAMSLPDIAIPKNEKNRRIKQFQRLK